MRSDLTRWFTQQYPGVPCPTNRAGELLGWMYVPQIAQDDHGPAHPGAILLATDSMGILVELSIDTVLPASWPGRLWKVRVLQPSHAQTSSYLGFVRAQTLEVIAEEPLAHLFPWGGFAIAETLTQINAIAPETVAALNASYQASTPKLLHLIWDRWLEASDPHSYLVGMDHLTLLRQLRGVARSPIGPAPSLLFASLHRQAIATGSVADSSVPPLPDPWFRAGVVLLGHLFALGCDPEVITTEERNVLAGATLTI